MNCKKTLFDFVRAKKHHKLIDLDDKEVKKYFIENKRNPDVLFDVLSSCYHTSIEGAVARNNISNSERLVTDRYFVEKIRCSECNLEGKHQKNCKHHNTEVCVYCGDKHDKQRCKNIICKKCKQIGHNSSKCKNKLDESKKEVCNNCIYGSHFVYDCPKVWREYKFEHPFDDKGIIKSCCLCGSDKHFVDDCNYDKSKISVFNSKYLSSLEVECKSKNEDKIKDKTNDKKKSKVKKLDLAKKRNKTKRPNKK